MKVLFISYHFPPDNSVGGLRIAKFSKYLPGFGWNASVLTVKDKYYEGLDLERLKDVEGVKVYRSSTLPTVREGFLYIKSLLKKPANGAAPAPSALPEDKEAEKKEGMGQRLKRIIISTLLLLPDDKRNWVVPGVLKAVWIVKRQGIDCIITSTPPHSSHVIGLIAKKITGVKWVADFRDPWTDVLHYKPTASRSSVSDKMERWLEKAVILGADRVLTTTDILAKVYRERYGVDAVDRIKSIPNGIYTEKFSGGGHANKFDRFTITYAGNLYAGRTPEPVLKAVKKLLDEGRLDESEINLRFMGDCGYVEGVPTADLVRRYGLESVVSVYEPVQYLEALEIMKRSHLLLLLSFVPEEPLQVPAKIYDYFGTGTKILAVCDKGSATDEIMNSTGFGESFDSSMVSEIAEFIYKCVKKDSGPLGEEEMAGVAERFGIKRLSGELAEVLTSLTVPEKRTGEEALGRRKAL